ncbi:MAG: domain S-box, partial [Evtepia sp.]|nr:domain S-box [Evtepia sp.]
MKRKIFLFSMLLALISVILTSIVITITTYNHFFHTIKQEIALEATYLRPGIEHFGTDYLSQIEVHQGHRLTIIAPDGTVFYDSSTDPAQMDNHRNRPEVQAALSSGVGESTRYSDTLREQTYYYAILLGDGSVLRLASATESVIATYDQLFWLVVLIAIIAFLLAAAIASLATRKIVRPINNIDLDNPEHSVVYDEIVPLLTRIKNQRNQIKLQIEELNRQRAEFSTVTENMNEGLLVLDGDGTVLSYNKSAMKLLNTHAMHPVGVNILSLNRSNQFREAIQSASQGLSLERIIEIAGRQCQLYVSPVTSANTLQGIIVILMDVTEKQEREKLRREFTANVSHELKTPLTAISGYAEIMMNGVAKPEDIPEFSQSIYQEAKRLIALVQDLMFLSKLEESTPPPKELVNLLTLSREVVSRLKAKATEFGITVSVSGESAEILGIPSVLEEMLYNLLDNAIKYNRNGGSATITIQNEGDIILKVSDTGIGVPKSEQSRVF